MQQQKAESGGGDDADAGGGGAADEAAIAHEEQQQLEWDIVQSDEAVAAGAAQAAGFAEVCVCGIESESRVVVHLSPAWREERVPLLCGVGRVPSGSCARGDLLCDIVATRVASSAL